MAIFGPPRGWSLGPPPPPPPLYQRQIFVKKGPKEDSKTRAWLDFGAFLRVSDPKNGVLGVPPKTPQNGHFWPKMAILGLRRAKPPKMAIFGVLGGHRVETR